MNGPALYERPSSASASWRIALPHTVAADLTLYPSGSTLLVATHGRGLWRISRL